jgi:hypothetical protein
VKCPRCGNEDPNRFATVVESTGYRPLDYKTKLAFGGDHGGAVLKGWRCLVCGETSDLKN